MSNYNWRMNTCIIALVSRIRENANHLILKELHAAGFGELAPSHGDILMALYDSNELSMQNIAKKIHRTKATTTVLIDKLEVAGFVKRKKSEVDSRYTIVSLTEKGGQFRKTFEMISDKLNKTAFKNLNNHEIMNLERLLFKIQENLE